MRRGVALAALVLAACDRGPVHRVWSGEAMGSSLEIQAVGPDAAVLDAAISDARAEVERLDRMMTDWRETGALMEVNRAAGVRPVRVPPELFFLVRRSLQASELTDGAFDITWAGAGKLWKWWEKDPQVPSDEAVRAAVAHVGWRKVVLDERESTVFLPEVGMRIGLGAIAPGYAGDLALRKMRARGVENALVNLSGDVAAAGTNRGRPWTVAVKHPRRPGEALMSIPLIDRALSTSGDYERFFVKDGKRYGHIIDPRTGYPADACQSVTVLGPTLAFADALATGVFVLGPKRGMELVERLEGVDAIIVAADGTVTLSRGLKGAGL
jgi:thiamine biosynthesis lipoprotein